MEQTRRESIQVSVPVRSNVKIEKDSIHKQVKQANSLRTMMIIGTCLFVIGMLAIPLFKAYQTGQVALKDYKEAQANNIQAVENNRIIQAEYQRSNDPSYLEDIARRDYYYSKQGEIIFILPESQDGIEY